MLHLSGRTQLSAVYVRSQLSKAASPLLSVCKRFIEFQVYNVHDTSLHGIRRIGQGPAPEDTNTHPPEHAIKMPELRRSRYECCELALLLAVSKFPSALQSCGTDMGLLSIMTANPAYLLPPRIDKARCSQCFSPFAKNIHLLPESPLYRTTMSGAIRSYSDYLQGSASND